MHSSRMHTVCSGEAVAVSQGEGLVSQHALRQIPPVDRHTPVKI